MSDNEDNEDYFGDEAPQEEAEDVYGLFGDEDVDQEQQPGEEIDDAADEQPQAAPPSGDARRQAMQALIAQNKAADETTTKKRKQKDKKEGKQLKRQKSASQSSGKAAAQPEEEEDPLFGGDEDEDALPTDADQQFIDDEGAEQYGDEMEEPDDRPIREYEEAEEVPEGQEEETIRGGKKRSKKELTEAERKQREWDIKLLITKMEAAAKKDQQLCLAKQPAIHKLGLLRDVDAKLGNRGWHEDLIACNISKALVCWLEPCCDKSTGKVTMPHVKIREAVLRWVDMLPLDTSRETHKSQIVETNIGKYIMYLTKYDGETAANKRLATKIVERWVRPIMARAPAPEQRENAEQMRAYMERQRLEREQKATQQKAMADPLVQGRRVHAHIPMPSKLDYVMEPTPKFEEVGPAGPRASGPKGGILDKKLRDISRRVKQAEGRSAAKGSSANGGVLMMG